MYYVVHRARQEGWLTVYIPKCDSWRKAGSIVDCRGWFAYFLDAVLFGLANATLSTDIRAKYGAYSDPPTGHSSWQDALLADDGISLQVLNRRFQVSTVPHRRAEGNGSSGAPGIR